MPFAWRNHPIALLHASSGPDDPPDYPAWTLWVEGTERQMGAVGAAYIKRMIDDLEWDGAGLPEFIEPPSADDPNAIPTIIKDPRTLAYQKEIVKLAVAAGKSFAAYQDPVATEASIRANYAAIEQEVTSFGAQLFSQTKKHFSTVFSDAGRKTYPLKPLLEWKWQ
mmetsp:Transcript_30943/g.64196  ORF Transcript_30943/g.64196 Transcript_30943/m.64196 type:complete len:166 (+) Transcript_30943:146-643(+)